MGDTECRERAAISKAAVGEERGDRGEQPKPRREGGRWVTVAGTVAVG
jgi:hypothetical protein